MSGDDEDKRGQQRGESLGGGGGVGGALERDDE